MKRIYLLIIVLSIAISGHSQLLRSIANSAANQAKNSAANKASEKVNKEVDKGVNKLFDDLMKEDSTETKKETAKPANGNNGSTNDQPPAAVNSFMKKLGVSTEAVPHKEVYKFTGKITMSIEVTDEKGEQVSNMEYETCFNEKSTDAMFKTKVQDASSSSATIIDGDNSCILILTETNGQKTGIATKFDPNAAKNTKPVAANKEVNEPETNSKPSDDCTPVKTGKTKVISGFNCSEYRCEADEVITSVWVTKDYSATHNKLFSNSALGTNYKTDGFDGMMIQYESRSKVDKSSSVMTVKSLETNKSSSFSTVGYQISSFNINSKK